MDPDFVQYKLLREDFAGAIRLFGRVDPSSLTPSKCVEYTDLARELKAEMKGCIVCGWTPGQPPFSLQSPDGSVVEYPAVPARHAISTGAHILPHPNDCAELDLPFDKSNFLPLCGAKSEKPSCHSAFDSKCLSFVKEPLMPMEHEHHRWRVHTVVSSIYGFLNGKIVDLAAFKPHRRALHGHALSCALNLQVTWSTEIETRDSRLDTTPPKAEDFPSQSEERPYMSESE